MMTSGDAPLVHFRTPTFRRPDTLLRTLKSMQAQTVATWICDVYDDDPEGLAKTVVEGLADARIRYTQNATQRHATGNIDRCFTQKNPHSACWFGVVEDDDYLLPTYIEENIATASAHNANILLRNQFIEMRSGTPDAWVTDYGIQDSRFREGFCSPQLLRMATLADFGVSHGGIFWSRNLSSDLELGFPCNVVLQEHLRTLLIGEPIYVAMKPLAVWAKKDESTFRNSGDQKAHLRRELDLKRSLQRLRQQIWKRMSPEDRARYLRDPSLLYDPETRARSLVKALIKIRVPGMLRPLENVQLLARGLLIRAFGRTSPKFDEFIEAQ